MAWGNINIPMPEGAAGADPYTLWGMGQEMATDMGAGGGDAGGHYYDPVLGQIYELLASLGFSAAEAQAAGQYFREVQFPQELAFKYYQANAVLEAAGVSAGASMYGADMSLQIAQMQAANALEIARLNDATNRYIADKEFEIRLKEMLSGERIAAANIYGNPIDYLCYNRWMLDYDAMTTESGLPVGAPNFYTGEPEVATVGTGPVATGQADVYGQAMAEGQRIPEFNAWGGETTPIEGTPWIAPHQQNVTQFSYTPDQAQQMAFARWRRRGITPETAQQVMLAAAPLGTAQGVGYG